MKLKFVGLVLLMTLALIGAQSIVSAQSTNDREWATSSHETLDKIVSDTNEIVPAAQNADFATVRYYCSDLQKVVGNGLIESRGYSVSPKYQESKNWYEMGLEEYYSACSDIIAGIDNVDANKIKEGIGHLEKAGEYMTNANVALQKAINS